MKTPALLLSLAATLSACGPTGGPVAGAADTHCGSTVVTPSQSECMGMAPADAGMAEEEPEVRFNAEADDDDCKYHVKFTTTPVTENADVTVTAVITRKSDGQPATAAEAELEWFLDATHPAPNTNPKTTETTPGTYAISPLRFNAAGQWTMKFHLYGSCSDAAEESPHGHVSFYLAVP
jgi:hypothetical protein